MKLEAFKNLITDFKSISSSEPYEQTFMDLSGYPHYENVCSNILAFYFDSKEAHNLGDLLLLALCKSQDNTFDEYHFDDVEIEREVLTSGGKKIDIVIKDSNHLIAIENKIFQDVYNDLKNYSDHIKSISEGRKIIKIVLSLYSVDPNLLARFGFTNILYSDLFSKVEELIGSYILEANTKYLNYLFDFIKTIKRLERGTVMNSDFIKFLSENENDINRLLVETSNLRKEFRRKLQELSELIDIEKYPMVKQSFYKELFGELWDELYYEYRLSDNDGIYIEAFITPSGWYFEVNPIKKKSKAINDFLAKKNINLIDSYEKGTKRIDVNYNYDENLEIIASTLQKLIYDIAS